MYGILKDRKVVACGYFRQLRWLSDPRTDRRVGRDLVGDYTVSTVFLSVPIAKVSQNSKDPGDYYWFETLVTHPAEDELDDRYSSWEEAEAGHRRHVELCRSKLRRNDTSQTG